MPRIYQCPPPVLVAARVWEGGLRVRPVASIFAGDVVQIWGPQNRPQILIAWFSDMVCNDAQTEFRTQVGPKVNWTKSRFPECLCTKNCVKKRQKVGNKKTDNLCCFLFAVNEELSGILPPQKSRTFVMVIPVCGFIILITSNRNYHEKCRFPRYFGNSWVTSFLEF